MYQSGFLLMVTAMLLPCVTGQELPAPANHKVDFTREVRPLLEAKCWSCHGADQQESGLRLDRRRFAMEGGDHGRVLTPGNSGQSRLIHFVAGSDPKKVMPPDGAPLTAREVGLLRAWIDQGAEWPEDQSDEVLKSSHWAYQPLRVPSVPVVRQDSWPAGTIDRFALAMMEQHGLSPSPEADRYTLIRRLYLDLLGLLPSVEQVDEFVNDESPRAWEKLVDQCLSSPHFGERWGRHWLDMARYADSDGYEKDNPRPDAYRWRDWVIDSINSDMPFDQFTIEQLAGDLLPDATPMQKLATAFHRQTLTNTEGGTDKEQFRVEACFDRTETTGSVWLGLTIGCARCHSHKYDAISQREYYKLFAVFNNGDEQTTVVPRSDAEVAAYAETKSRHDAAVTRLKEKIRRSQTSLLPEFRLWMTHTATRLKSTAAAPSETLALRSVEYTSEPEVAFKESSDGAVLVSGNNPETAVYTIVGQLPAAAAANITALRLDVLTHASLPAEGPGRVTHGNFVLSEVSMDVATRADFSDAAKAVFNAARADFEQADRPWSAAGTIDGKPETGWAVAPQYGKPHWLLLGLTEPLQLKEPLFFRIQLHQNYGRQHTIGHFRISLLSGLVPQLSLPQPLADSLLIPEGDQTAEQREQLLDYFSRQHPETSKLLASLDKLEKNAPAKPELTVRVIQQRVQDPRRTFVLKRGEFLDPIAELEMTPGGLAVLPEMRPRNEGRDADRLDLARWLVSPDNPLTPRVTVNHIWRQLFGSGLVRTPNDFGVRGERPTHPELLDWLAADFAGLTNESAGTEGRAAWSRKSLIRKIVISATYRQSSALRPGISETDPQNLWLSRQNRIRVEGEIIRDLCLDAAGLLSRRIGGPSVYPPLPPGIAELSYAGNFKWKTSAGDDRYRRGMYTFFKRTSPHPNLTTFDCPDANLTCIARQTSNTPLQALTCLNNETFTEAAKMFAERVLAVDAGDDRSRLRTAFRICLGRPATEAELHSLADLLQDSLDWYKHHPEQAALLVGSDAKANQELAASVERTAAWIAASRIILNLDEFITRE